MAWLHSVGRFGIADGSVCSVSQLGSVFMGEFGGAPPQQGGADYYGGSGGRMPPPRTQGKLKKLKKYCQAMLSHSSILLQYRHPATRDLSYNNT